MNKNFFIEAFKYGIVGILNTFVTAVVIWLMMHALFHVRDENNVSAQIISISNIAGYIAGLINSFVWNRKWTFKSKTAWKKDFRKFILAFLICYIPQLFIVNLLNHYMLIPEIQLNVFHHSSIVPPAYICQLAGIVFYTVMNFLCNKYYTFRKQTGLCKHLVL
ncbi:MAG: GtrA family protein [Dysgonamonadaceae bacterium]|jgi:putative flippase GtrA|nr:GtrA family protein [Dysgonamonadaceae bacterium]